MAPSFSLLSLEYIPKRSPAAALPHKHEPPSTMTRVGDHGYFFFAYFFLCINDLEVRQDLRSLTISESISDTWPDRGPSSGRNFLSQKFKEPGTPVKPCQKMKFNAPPDYLFSPALTSSTARGTLTEPHGTPHGKSMQGLLTDRGRTWALLQGLQIHNGHRPSLIGLIVAVVVRSCFFATAVAGCGCAVCAAPGSADFARAAGGAGGGVGASRAPAAPRAV